MAKNVGGRGENHRESNKMFQLVLFVLFVACLTGSQIISFISLWQVNGLKNRPIFGETLMVNNHFEEEKKMNSTSTIPLWLLFRNRTTGRAQPKAFVTAIQPLATSKKLYVCGYDHPSIAQELFPDYNYAGKLVAGQSAQPDDVVVYGSFGPCPYSISQFPGKILYMNGEPEEQPIHLPNEFRIGPSADDDVHSIRYYHFVTILLQDFPSSMWSKITDPRLRPQSSLEYKAVMYTSGNCVEIRQTAAETISTVVPIVFGGRCIVRTVLNRRRGSLYKDKSFIGMEGRNRRAENYKVYRKFQFCLVMDRVNQEGYISEKLLFAYLGGCLPIYYGTTDVFQIFHPESFVYYNVSNPQPALNLLQQLYTNETAYQERMQKPILRQGQQTIEQYFSITDKLGNGSLKGRVRQMMGLSQTKVKYPITPGNP